MPWPGRPQGDLVQILPKVLSHQPKGTEVGRTKCVEIGVTVIGVGTKPLQASSAQGTLACTSRIPTHDVIVQFGMDIPVKREKKIAVCILSNS